VGAGCDVLIKIMAPETKLEALADPELQKWGATFVPEFFIDLF